MSRTIDKEYNITRDSLASMALVNCRMILENAVSMPDSYIEEHYGSDSNMCKVAEQYFDLAVKIYEQMPQISVYAVTQHNLHFHDEEDEE